MSWIVDTCVLLDIHLNDPVFGRPAADCLAHCAVHGLAATSTTVIELAPAFNGDLLLLEEFLALVGVAHQTSPGAVAGLTPAWDGDDTVRAFAAWHHHVQARRASGGTVGRRPVADLLIATVATRFSGVITRNAGHFRAFFPAATLAIVDPMDRGTWPTTTG